MGADAARTIAAVEDERYLDNNLLQESLARLNACSLFALTREPVARQRKAATNQTACNIARSASRYA
jgi:hypothetical protein